MTPHPEWMKRRFTMPRPWEKTAAEAFSEVHDCSRGEVRLAAEVALAGFNGDALPAQTVQRAMGVLAIMARS